MVLSGADAAATSDGFGYLAAGLPDWQSIIAPDFLRLALAPLEDDKHCAQPCGAALAN